MKAKNLIQKYNVPGPRYTSYPTVPYWDKSTPSEVQWKQELRRAFQNPDRGEGISLYIHLPFCESLCTYCGCNTRITLNHGVESPYIETLLKEWQLYLDVFPQKPLIREIHLGGGTPTFFSAANLKRLLEGILAKAELSQDAELGFEAHPGNTRLEHLITLYKLGFRRLSLGIQDFDPEVQKTINRIQSVYEVASITQAARDIGYTSINYDLIYGLPKQSPESIQMTLEWVRMLRPDRIAFYSYAHVPWIKPSQRSYTEKDLPSDEAKRKLYELGKLLLDESGYKEIGMDHFALESDALYQAFDTGTLHRNFMGYTPLATRLLVGLGASAISDSWTMFVQNLKKVEDYRNAVEHGHFPFFRGHPLNEEDLQLRQHILDLMCQFQTQCNPELFPEEIRSQGIPQWQQMVDDGILEKEGNCLQVTPKGRPFVRNICMTLDARLLRAKPQTPVFSKTI